MISDGEITVKEGGDTYDIHFTANMPPNYLCQTIIPDNGLCEVNIVAVVESVDEPSCTGSIDGLVVPQV